ncbi:MAG: DUF523 domain-containing protein [Clostridiales bacterium]|jgi:uncharacterized protein YbbK (DUF523 family)|nr:DUF523 domain-containing protein [Clostridiales bacterium]
MYLVSSCLAGIPCRYDGKSCTNPKIAELVKQGRAIPVCPEQLAGLPVPRACCEIVADKNGKKKVMSANGKDLTKEFEDGAQKALRIAKENGITKAVLKSKSPSCGCGCIYDGTFSGKVIPGNGIAAQLFLENGIEVLTENEADMQKVFG